MCETLQYVTPSPPRSSPDRRAFAIPEGVAMPKGIPKDLAEALAHASDSLTRCAANQRDGVWRYINGLLDRINR